MHSDQLCRSEQQSAKEHEEDRAITRKQCSKAQRGEKRHEVQLQKQQTRKHRMHWAERQHVSSTNKEKWASKHEKQTKKNQLHSARTSSKTVHRQTDETANKRHKIPITGRQSQERAQNVLTTFGRTRDTSTGKIKQKSKHKGKQNNTRQTSHEWARKQPKRKTKKDQVRAINNKAAI